VQSHPFRPAYRSQRSGQVSPPPRFCARLSIRPTGYRYCVKTGCRGQLTRLLSSLRLSRIYILWMFCSGHTADSPHLALFLPVFGGQMSLSALTVTTCPSTSPLHPIFTEKAGWNRQGHYSLLPISVLNGPRVLHVVSLGREGAPVLGSFPDSAPFNLLYTLSGPSCPRRDSTRLSRRVSAHKRAERGCASLGSVEGRSSGRFTLRNQSDPDGIHNFPTTAPASQRV
jgi:hypothetical protein